MSFLNFKRLGVLMHSHRIAAELAMKIGFSRTT